MSELLELSDEKRAAIVEMLRCAADIAISGDRGSALGIAATTLEMTFSFPCGMDEDPHWVKYLRGNGPVHDQPERGYVVCGNGYEFCLLEAAQLVEEGSWP